MPKKGGKRKKTRTHAVGSPQGATVLDDTSVLKEDIPRSIVAKSGKTSLYVSELVSDFRRMMAPFTALKLREKRDNRMKDYVAVAGPLGVTHLLIFSQSKSNIILRIGKFPNGPTIYFRINQYSLCKQVRSTQKRPFKSNAAFLNPPLVVLNNFGQSEESHMKLLKVTFQHMFPTINLKTIRLSECSRVVLFHLNKEEGAVEMRHYAIKATPVGISRSIKKIIQCKIPDLGKLEDLSQFIDGSVALGAASDSEAEDETSKVTLPDRYVGKGNAKAQYSAMKLIEIGPRLLLEIYKVMHGLNEGDVLYHKFESKSPLEAAQLKAKAITAKLLKQQRRAEQEANVKRKRDEIEEKKKVKSERKRVKIEEKIREDEDEDADDEEAEDSHNDDESMIDDYDDVDGEDEENENS